MSARRGKLIALGLGAALVAGFAYHPEPALYSLSPDSGSGTGGTAVTINGSGFTAATGVHENGKPRLDCGACSKGPGPIAPGDRRTRIVRA